MRLIISLNLGALPRTRYQKWSRPPFAKASEGQGRVAQLVEHGIHKPAVASSILAPATIKDIFLARQTKFCSAHSYLAS